jgi:hypothetical protein
MGGRGGSFAVKEKAVVKKQSEQPKQKQSKQKAKQGKPVTIQKFIQEQVGVDIDKYRDETTRRFDMQGGINVDWKRMPEDAKNKIQRLAAMQYDTNISLEDNGAWMKLIRIRKRS